MPREIPKAYEPQLIEQKWAKKWAEENLFRADVNAPGPVFSIVIPPPNVTGSLHIGHMLDHTEIDILTRWRRMQGYNTLYLPGTDHAGISTQRVVVRQLAAQGINYRDLGREAFERKVWEWKAESGGTITRQMLQLGESCDWTRERFTLSPELSRAVTEVFVRLYEDGLIYRGHYIVNWCPQCRTAISDLETVHEERQGHLWHIRYPIVGTDEYCCGGHHAARKPCWEIRPWPCIPSDPRYQHLIGKMVLLPLMNREIPIVDDFVVDREFGTGAVKVTPAHDPNDFEIGRRHDLPEIDVMTDDAKMSAAAGPYAGLDRFEARKRVVADLEAGRIPGQDRGSHACRRHLRPLRHDHRAARIDAMVCENEAAGRTGDCRRGARRDRNCSRESPHRIFRVDAQHSRLVHFAATVVGTPDPGVVLRRLQGNHRFARDCRPNARNAVRPS